MRCTNFVAPGSAKTDGRNCIKFYYLLHPSINWCWLDFGKHGSEVSLYSKFPISLTHRYRTKLLAIVPNADYFKPTILKFKKFIYNSNSKIMHNFCVYGGNALPVGRSTYLLHPEKKFFNIDISWKNVSNYGKLMVEQYVCDDLNQTYRFFSFLTTTTTKKNVT